MKTISTKIGKNLKNRTEKKLTPTASAISRIDFFFQSGILKAVNPPCDPCGCRAFYYEARTGQVKKNEDHGIC